MQPVPSLENHLSGHPWVEEKVRRSRQYTRWARPYCHAREQGFHLVATPHFTPLHQVVGDGGQVDNPRSHHHYQYSTATKRLSSSTLLGYRGLLNRWLFRCDHHRPECRDVLVGGGDDVVQAAEPVDQVSL